MKKIIIAIFAVLAVILLWCLTDNFRGPGKSKEKERFVVALEAKEEEVIDNLVSQGFLKNKNIYKLSLNFVCFRRKTCPKTGERITPGAYQISKSMNTYV